MRVAGAGSLWVEFVSKSVGKVKAF